MASSSDLVASLAEQAQQFADRLTTSVHSVAARCAPFQATAVAEALRCRVLQDPDTGIPLSVTGVPILTLKVSYDCTLDRQDRYLAVDGSKVSVYAGVKASGEPLFRYEYVRRMRADIPAAHLQIHAHRDAITFAMDRSGGGTRRARERRDSDAVPRLAELHFPLGGHRFRPCLEDVLEMLVEEFGVDCSPAGRETLRDGREQWRRRQVGTVVRDAPEEAIEVLADLGYQITFPEGAIPPAGNPHRLRDF